eukprot:scaffold225416_cov41-Prasinocladus_malaysianus.AAC.1
MLPLQLASKRRRRKKKKKEEEEEQEEEEEEEATWKQQMKTKKNKEVEEEDRIFWRTNGQHIYPPDAFPRVKGLNARQALPLAVHAPHSVQAAFHGSDSNILASLTHAGTHLSPLTYSFKESRRSETTAAKTVNFTRPN